VLPRKALLSHCLAFAALIAAASIHSSARAGSDDASTSSAFSTAHRAQVSQPLCTNGGSALQQPPPSHDGEKSALYELEAPEYEGDEEEGRRGVHVVADARFELLPSSGRLDCRVTSVAHATPPLEVGRPRGPPHSRC